jgi:hypothetical protein
MVVLLAGVGAVPVADAADAANATPQAEARSGRRRFGRSFVFMRLTWAGAGWVELVWVGSI